MSWKDKKKFNAIIVPVLILVPIIIIGFLIYDYTEENIRNSLIEEQIKIQEIIGKGLGNNISSDLKLVKLEMSLLSETEEFEEGLTNPNAIQKIKETYEKINSITPITDVILLNSEFQIIGNARDDIFKIAGYELGENSVIRKTISDKKSGITAGVVGNDSILRITVLHSINDETNNEFKGIVATVLEPRQLFAKHGNVYDVDSSFIVALDKDEMYISNPIHDLIGKKYSEYFAQTYFGRNQVQNEHYENVFSGEINSAILMDNRLGEIISTGLPIYVDGELEYFVFVITPTDIILSKTQESLLVEEIKNNLLLIAFALLFIVFFIKRSKKLEKEKLAVIGQLSSNIAHDMRNPLGAIRSSSRRIEKQNTQQNEIISQEIARINRSIKRMSHQVEGVLNYVRTTPIIANSASILNMIKYSLESMEIPQNVKVVLPENDVEIECDPEKLEITFVNVLLNAVQAIGNDEGKIQIRIKEKKNTVVVEFENSGPAISEIDLPKIFEPLFTSKLKGTGLGLSSCKNIIEQHGGSISVNPNPVVFKITLPKKQNYESQ
ncbi:MAG: GHKL domain-containing protein [Crenarchaeota archaeon]|nr:MAG: GHKL domain-containing protein [Thermoproteota archaeon]RDJ34630.1 MAG: GHKL domain-containing protein [Thermoproteota archaeon]RDJ34703.1 MAG: GHKL domain-containing protein [Thermoproteota archaeon]RDJ38426.1 MAG: GHKL domain-containing protein [Thermoproteota archaeon]